MKMHAWWLGRQDARKLIGMADNIENAAVSVQSLIKLRNAKLMRIDADYRKEIEGHRGFLLEPAFIDKPNESNVLGKDGRAWHNYLQKKLSATNAADAIVSLTEICTSELSACFEETQAVHAIYVSTFKRHHPRRDQLSNWNPKLDAYDKRLGKPDDSLKVLVLEHCSSSVEANIVLKREITED
jgi:hypothetical protein